MNKPAAISKAEMLAKYAQGQGSPLSTWLVVVTRGEAYELLDHLAEGGMGRFANHDQLVEDIKEAKVLANPWLVLDHFQLCGMSIARADLVLN